MPPTQPSIAPPKPFGRIIGAFKTVSPKQINLLRDMAGVPIWQRNYYERIIRDESALHNIQAYIQNNPAQRAKDKLQPIDNTNERHKS
ncbi:MAG: transposase [Leptolyngbyaceae cyanobacterium bins.349]|nr:transposase [Leptolyngbyaceae cyanobacterium bins.349]